MLRGSAMTAEGIGRALAAGEGCGRLLPLPSGHLARTGDPGHDLPKFPDALICALAALDRRVDAVAGAAGRTTDTAPRPQGSCGTCGGAVGYFNGEPTPNCYHCHIYRDALDGIVSITYSLDNGLESMLHKYKDWEGKEWLAYPLASLLHVFLNDHLECIEDVFGPIDVFTMAPPNTERDFDRLARLSEVVDEARAGRDWTTNLIGRNTAVPPPGRGQVAPEAYVVHVPTWSAVAHSWCLTTRGPRAVPWRASGRPSRQLGQARSWD